MIRIASLIAATTLTISLGVMIEPAQAQSPAYRAVPVAAVTSNVIVDGTMWHCGSDGCVANNVSARPAIACAQAVQKVGKLSSFVVGTQPFDEAALTKCNAKAKA